MARTRLKVRVLCARNSLTNKSVLVGRAVVEGARRAGHTVEMVAGSRVADADVVMIYGVGLPVRHEVFKQFNAAGKAAVSIDLGYWRREDAGGSGGYYRVSVGDLHPPRLLPNRKRDGTRFDKLNIEFSEREPVSASSPILIAGMGPKSCVLYGIEPGSWETKVVAQLRSLTKRKIIYRPKPSWRNAPAIPGTSYSAPDESLRAVLRRAWAVVTHHSNVAVDAMMYGVPAFTEDGAAGKLCPFDLDQIETPNLLPFPLRRQFCHDLAWFQWTLNEFRSGVFWDWFDAEQFVARPMTMAGALSQFDKVASS